MSVQPSGAEPATGRTGRRRIGIGTGLVQGLIVTAKTMFRPSHTDEYPDVRPPLPSRSRGVIGLVQENCTSCGLCARECPDWCIQIEAHKETLPAVAGGRSRQRNVLDSFTIDFSLCMYCGICVEVCPFDALIWSSEFEYAEYDIVDLTHDKGRLSQWAATAPPPPPADPAAMEPKEVGAARKALERAAKKAAAPRAAAGPSPAARKAAAAKKAVPAAKRATPEGHGTETPEERGTGSRGEADS